MPRSLPELATRALLAAQSDAAVWFLLEISHPTELPTPLRFVNNTEPVVRLGETWNPYWFDVTLPSEDADQLPKVTLTLENIEREILDALRALESPLDVKLYVVTSADETMVVGPVEFVWRDTQYDATTIQGSLEGEDTLNQRWPKDEFVPSKFPGLSR